MSHGGSFITRRLERALLKKSLNMKQEGVNTVRWLLSVIGGAFGVFRALCCGPAEFQAGGQPL